MFAERLLIVLVVVFLVMVQSQSIPSVRPDPSKRTYQSTVIDQLLTDLTPLFKNQDIATLFSNCLPNTLDTTVSFAGQSFYSTGLDSFVITGDINALWLRDSANQVMPYVPYAASDVKLQQLLEGLISRHAHSVNIDPFANAFNYNASRQGHQSDIRVPAMQATIFEGKYEIDSLGAFLKLSYWYYRAMGKSILDTIMTKSWFDAVTNTLKTIKAMQEDTGMSSDSPYRFQRLTTQALDTLSMSGRGPPAKPCGLTRSLFRPSDDAVTLPYNIPGNAMACTELRHLEEMLNVAAGSLTSTSDRDLASKLYTDSQSISAKLCGALESVLKDAASANEPIPYEVDGLKSSSYFMDDANVPSLMSLPFLGYMQRDARLYMKTRNFVLSKNNPFFFSGSQGEGVGGPHVGPDFAWPMSVVMRAMTSNSDDEVVKCLDLLVRSSAGTGFMHESFNVDNVNDYTRSWFAWANGLFGELVLQLIVERPHLILQDDPAVIAKAQSLVKTPISLQAQLDLAK